jgi:transcriptional regulator with XRE-family HTH domain
MGLHSAKTMAKRAHTRTPNTPTRTPKFGAFLVERRGKRKRPAIAALMRERGFPIDQSTLWRYEKGTRTPGAAELLALSVGYGVNVATLCERIASELLGIAVRAKRARLAPALSREAQQLGEMFDQWDEKRRKAFLVVAGLTGETKALVSAYSVLTDDGLRALLPAMAKAFRLQQLRIAKVAAALPPARPDANTP